ncbi:hypothetical protein A9Q81_12995 [Gammaproteobacteria bacterium 42_54_T18]|nr:hypothetical protein A9Q81_12995 [Gammaproteobacteria bacterium 42_54_T18]
MGLDVALPAIDDYGLPENEFRQRLIRFCIIVGFSVPALCWLAVLLGVTREVFPHDQVAVLGVLFSVYAPILVFINNKGEKRPLEKQLVEFAFLFFFTNVGYQFFWEMPWFMLKETIYGSNITEADKWFWPWWAYGVADTRYLKPNELSISISGMDASVAMLEVFIVAMYYKGYRLMASWFALIMGSCMGWGQYYFYMGEIYFEFVNLEDGWFGFWFKYIILNIPWLIFPFIAGAGFIWHIASHYKKIAVDEYLSKAQSHESGNQFYDRCNILIKTNDNFETIESDKNQALVKRLIFLAFVSPLIFIATDIYLHYQY